MITGHYVAQVTPALRVLSDDQKAHIHQATLELLRRTGVRVLDAEVRELLAKAGCWIDDERVRIPPHLIERAIRAAPKRVVMCHRDGKPAMFLEGYNSYYGTGSDTPFVIDAYSGERRQAVRADVVNVARLVDALPYISFLMCMGIASDVTESISDLHHFQAMVSNTAKPIVYTAWNRQNLKDIIAMAEVVAGGAEALQRNPFCALYSEPMAPLVHGKESCEKLLYICGKGLPVVYTPGLITGASSPVTRAGAVVQANAELLSGLLICQSIREGTPVVAGGSGMMTMDMSTMLASYGAPEFMLGSRGRAVGAARGPERRQSDPRRGLHRVGTDHLVRDAGQHERFRWFDPALHGRRRGHRGGPGHRRDRQGRPRRALFGRGPHFAPLSGELVSQAAGS